MRYIENERQKIGKYAKEKRNKQKKKITIYPTEKQLNKCMNQFDN